MKITKSKLRRIIKEALLKEIGGVRPFADDYDDEEFEDDELEVVTADELFPDQGGIIEAVGAGTIALGVVLGILAYKAIGPIAVTAATALKHVSDKLERRVRSEVRKTDVEVEDIIVDAFSEDQEFMALLEKYNGLIGEVDSIMGQRGKEFQKIRQDKKDVSKQLTAYIDSHLMTMLQGLGKDHKKAMARSQKHGRGTHQTASAAKSRIRKLAGYPYSTGKK